jgi:hypothetical protein
VCVGAAGRKQLKCGKCLWFCSLNLSEKTATQMSRIAPLFFKFLFIALLGMFFNSDYTIKFVCFL